MCYVPILTSHQQRHQMHNLGVKYQFQNTVVIKFHHMYSKCYKNVLCFVLFVRNLVHQNSLLHQHRVLFLYLF